MFEQIENLSASLAINRPSTVIVEEQEPPPLPPLPPLSPLPPPPPLTSSSSSSTISPLMTLKSVTGETETQPIITELQTDNANSASTTGTLSTQPLLHEDTIVKAESTADKENEHELNTDVSSSSATATTTTTDNITIESFKTKKLKHLNSLTNQQHNNNTHLNGNYHHQYINSVKKSAITSLNLCSGLKRLRKKARLLGSQNFYSNYSNKYLSKYASYSSSSPSSSSSSSSSSSITSSLSSYSASARHHLAAYSSTFPICIESTTNSLNENKSDSLQHQIRTPVIKQKSPMKLHKFYHSVPFKCPFCFTFKEIPSDFINHLATVHYSDVKVLYEKRCHKLVNRKLAEKDSENVHRHLVPIESFTEDSLHNTSHSLEPKESTTHNNKSNDKFQTKEEVDEADEEDLDEVNEEEDEEDVSKSKIDDVNDSMQENHSNCKSEDILTAANLLSPPASLSSKLSNYSLPPRKQQRLLKSPLNTNSMIENTQTQRQEQHQQQEQSGPNWNDESVVSNSTNSPSTTNDNNKNYFNYYYKNSFKHMHQTPANHHHHHHFQKSMHKSNQGKPNLKEFLLPTSYIAPPTINNEQHQQKFSSKMNQSQVNNSKNILLNTAFASILKQHQNQQNMHQKSFSSNLIESSNQSMSQVASEASMKCAICDRGFEYYSNLRRHIKTKHKIFGKQVKEYVIRHTGQSTSNTGMNSANQMKSNTKLVYGSNATSALSCNSEDQPSGNQQQLPSLSSLPSLKNLVINQQNNIYSENKNGSKLLNSDSSQSLLSPHTTSNQQTASSTSQLSSSTISHGSFHSGKNNNQTSHQTSNTNTNNNNNNNTSSSYSDIIITSSKSGNNNGKSNSPLSSISSSSISSSKSYNNSQNSSKLVIDSNNSGDLSQQKQPSESLDDDMDQDEVASSSSSSSSGLSSSPVASMLQPTSSLLYSPSSSSNTTNAVATAQQLASSSSSSGAIPSAPKAAYSNNLNSTVAALAAAAAAAAAAASGNDLNSSLMAAAAANSLVPPHLSVSAGSMNPHQMASLLNNHAMSKIKSSLLESLLSRKMPNKFLATNNTDSMATMAAAMMASQGNGPAAAFFKDDSKAASEFLLFNNNEKSHSKEKLSNLTKLIQNIVEINQHHFTNNGANLFANLSEQEKNVLFGLQNQFKLNSLTAGGGYKSESTYNQEVDSSRAIYSDGQHEFSNQNSNFHHHQNNHLGNEICPRSDCNCGAKSHESDCDLDVVSNGVGSKSAEHIVDETNETNVNGIGMFEHKKKRRFCHSGLMRGDQAKTANNSNDYPTFQTHLHTNHNHHHEKSSNEDENYEEDLGINQVRGNDSNTLEDQNNDDQMINNQNCFYDDEESEIEEENNNNNNNSNNNNSNNNEEYEDDLRTRSRSSSSSSTSSNSSQSGCSSSISSMLMNQITSASTQSNKLLLNGIVGCSTPPMNQSAFESLKHLSQRNKILGIGGQANLQGHHHHHQHHHPHGNSQHQDSSHRRNFQQSQQPNNNNRHLDDNSHLLNNNNSSNKRKKSKDLNGSFNSLANNPSSIVAAIRSLQCSPSDQVGIDQSRLDATSPPSMMLSMASNGSSSNQNNNNQIRYSSEIWRCPYCCYETTSASRYNSHLVCHGWKPYLCPHCGSRSNRLPDMRTHISTFHPEFNVNTFVVLSEEEAKSTLKDYMKNRALINRKLKEMRPQPKFKCKLCPYASLYQFNLTKHVKSVHLSDIYNNKNNNGHNNEKNNINNNNSDNNTIGND